MEGDRFEGEFAVVELEDKKVVNMTKILLPNLSTVGDIIEITINHQETEKRNELIKRVHESLFGTEN